MHFPRTLLVPAIACATSLSAADWPHFLGPNHDLHCSETGLNLNFPESGPKKLWEVERGRGHAGPVVVGDRVVFIHQVDKNEQIRCLDAATGEERWQHSYPVEVDQNFGIVHARAR
jgi:outer membrane protein assembly factor BamB